MTTHAPFHTHTYCLELLTASPPILSSQPAAKTLHTPLRWNRVNSLTAFLSISVSGYLFVSDVFCYLCYVLIHRPDSRPDILFSGQLDYRSTSLQVTLLGRRFVSCYPFCSRTNEDGSRRIAD
ncbi:hypothetical protein An02g03150 [Aspergillus niger]|uniref:Uncharacterized protein n=2 Tax=Aspergillus niger TaxID=5061 RepID=A2QCD1_ASPNC|nr:hypothetical protein An02g03150 [Aspergillus niger]CAK47595.1 hypothetical protein An02g03150 [Aspergillus niger]